MTREEIRRRGRPTPGLGDVDVVYLAWNRRAFTELSFTMLLRNTEWELVRRLVVYDDGSEDGTREWLYDAIHGCPAEYHLEERRTGSPVAIMNDYVGSTAAAWFAKIDNDIVVPPGWLGELLGVVERNRKIELLGMEAGRMGPPRGEWDGVYGFEHATHIGGVGLIRTSTLGHRRRMVPDGRFGWTEFQHEYRPARGWIKPDLLVCSLDQVPLEPWQTLAAEYVEAGWSRAWPPYFARWSSVYWDWWAGEVESGDG